MTIKNNITDSDIEALFDHNDDTAFKDEFLKPIDEEIVPEELQVASKQTKIERPDEYVPDSVHEEKLKQKKIEQELLSAEKEALLNVKGQVTKEIFNKIAKLKQEAALEEYKEKQAKIPKINPNALVELYSDQPQCTFHVYQPRDILPGERIQCACKYCSAEKVFSIADWKQYQLENEEYF